MTEALTIDEIEARITGETPIGRASKVKPWVDLINDDCRVALKELDANSVDAVVTDPPYALTSEKKGGSGPASLNLNSPAGRARVTTGFMGKAWDTGETAFDPAFWQEVMRVLKPGGHVLAFGGSRTYHKIATAIDDAGFEIRDQIQWVYASGFPKSHDAAWDLHVQASRACGVMVEIDHGEPAAKHDLRFVRATYLQTPVYACAECGKVLQPFVPEQNAQAYRAAWSKSEASWAEQPIMEGWGDVETPTRKLQGCEVCSMPLGIFADGAEGWLRHGTPSRRGEIPWQIAEPDGSRPSYRPQSVEQLANQPEAVRLECRAQEFRGHGTALKPAHEPIVMARKPLVGTVATNLAKYGVGALNIDGCRVPSDDSTRRSNTAEMGYHGGNLAASYQTGSDDGRWPANVIHDGSDEVLDAFPNAPGQMADASTSSSSRKTQNVYGEMKRGNGRENEPSADSENEGAVGFKMKPGARRLDSGSAARFFYCAKASKKDREEGNTHPTVKPTELMRYLVRLVTPPGGTVLDPFMGSGSTGRGAVLEGFNFIGIEMSPEYFDIADARIAAAEKAFME